MSLSKIEQDWVTEQKAMIVGRLYIANPELHYFPIFLDPLINTLALDQRALGSTKASLP